MRFFLDCINDCFITNKIINNNFRATDANTGRAGTLDLFKIYDESKLPGTSSGLFENSRILLKFDFSKIMDQTASGGKLFGKDINDLKFDLKLFNIKHNDTVPDNFNVCVYPVAKQWNEGNGIDIELFQDLGAPNWVTASSGNLWEISGAYKTGSVGTTVDLFISDANLNSLTATKYIENGYDDLTCDITQICSATLNNIIDNNGILISFVDSEEQDLETRYVKRFFSRHSRYKDKAPRIEVSYNDSTFDDRSKFLFNTTGSLFLFNNINDELLDIDINGTPQTSLLVEVVNSQSSGSIIYSQFVTASKINTGTYTASFAVDQSNFLNSSVLNVNNLTCSMYDIWRTLDGTFIYSGSFTLKRDNYITTLYDNKYICSIKNLQTEYNKNEFTRLFVFIKDKYEQVKSKKIKQAASSLTFKNMFYQLRCLYNDNIIIPFDFSNYTTRLSSDSENMYFDFDFGCCLPVGELFYFEFAIKKPNGQVIYLDDKFTFKVTR